MPHPIYGPPNHVLTTVEFKLYLPTPKNGRRTRLEASGRSETSRTALWSVTESWAPEEVRAGLEPTDALHHLALVASQDLPHSQTGLEASLVGSGWGDVPLPF